MPLPRGRFDPARFMMNQLSAFAVHTPVKIPLSALYNKCIPTTRNGGLSTTDTSSSNTSSRKYASNGEQDESASERNERVIFAVRAPRGALTGAFSGVWNAAVGTIGAPVVALSIFLSYLLDNDLNGGNAAIGALQGIFAGPFYGMVFAAIGYVGGVQQVTFGALNSIRAPFYALIATPTMKYWSCASCTFIEPRVAPQAFVVNYRLSSDILFDAMKRNNNRKKKVNEGEKDSQTGPESGFSNKNKKKGDYYSLLGVSKSSSTKEIRSAYSKRAMELHPDKNPSPHAHEEFDSLNKAYKTLSNDQKRQRYDASGTTGDDNDRSKRSAIRMFFGGDDLQNLIGDVRKSSFNRRFIDDCDFGGSGGLKDLTVLNERLEDACCLELVNVYLKEYPDTSSVNTCIDSEQKQTAEESVEEWRKGVLILIQRYNNIGLSKEVMYTVGKQYELTCNIVSGSPFRRAVIFSSMVPNYIHKNGQKALAILKINPSVVKDPSLILDLIWKLSVTEIEQTAHRVAVRCLLDVDASPAEQTRRLAALREFSSMLISAGKCFEKIDKGVMDKMTESMQRYQSNKNR